MTELLTIIRQLFRDILLFAQHGSGITLRSYQQAAALAIVDSVIRRLGLTFVVIFPRQSGKNELQAQIEAYLLALLQTLDAEIVKVSPTWKPQSLNAMRRLERVLRKNIITHGTWLKTQGYIYKLNTASIFFLSGGPTANVVGATASTLLECDEAQDVEISKWDKEINPMAASTNATRVFWGTAWTSQTLLAREMRTALELEKKDGIRRVFKLTADDVRKEVPAYGKFVDGEIAKLGRNHPFIRTQFFSEEIDATGGFFPPDRLALMQGDHASQDHPQPGHIYAFLIDVAGGDETKTGSLEDSMSAGTDRDSTALTIVDVDLSTLDDELIQLPTYRIVKRHLWTGKTQVALYTTLRALIEAWQPQRIIIDATGIGAGLTSFLAKAYPGATVVPFIFSQSSKSSLGWDFIAVIESGRYKEHAPACGRGAVDLQTLFVEQCTATQLEVLPGPQRLLRWGVPDGTRDPTTGEPVHDDLVLSAALVGMLDNLPWGNAESAVIQQTDILEDLNPIY